MEKELFIMFVYDTLKCQKEDDDPQAAVLYFHPGWVNDQQRLALCGQLMGATQFFLTAFSCPRIISLNSGKFVVKQCGRYIMTVGTDHNVADWILEQRSKLLLEILQFYHRDLDRVCASVSSKGNVFEEKLYNIFEIYVPIVQFSGSIFSNIPTIKLPKSASNIFLEAIQILHCCQEQKNVLGGAVLYNNQVVASQLSSGLTKNLILTNPYRMKSAAENVQTPFHLPIGVQLLEVHLKANEYKRLSNDHEKAQSAFESAKERKNVQKKVSVTKVQPTKEQISAMKRDTSRIFTVPEEKEGDIELMENGINGFAPPEVNGIAKNGTHARSSTPMKDLNVGKFLHNKVMSICGGGGGRDSGGGGGVESGKSRAGDNGALFKSSKRGPTCLVNYCESDVHSLSLNDLHKGRVTNRRIPIRYYSFGLPRLTRDMCSGEDDETSPEECPPSLGTRHFFNTITDPAFPVFRADGVPISRYLFDEYVAQHYQLLEKERDSAGSSPPREQPSQAAAATVSSAAENSVNGKVPGAEDGTGTGTTASSNGAVDPAPKSEAYRRSLSLPLKSFDVCKAEGDWGDSGRRRTVSYGEPDLKSPIFPRNLPGSSLQLTPLINKLSLLALDENSSECGTPGEAAGAATARRERRGRLPQPEVDVDAAAPPEEAVMYICGQQGMALLLILKTQGGQDPELIHTLWKTSVSGLSRLESHLKQVLENFPQGESTEPYSFLCIDPSWDMLHCGGTWGTPELDTIGCLHNDFVNTSSLVEIVMRCEESTVYGYQCGESEVFYRQATANATGLPTPSDLMGIVPLKARRRLERDHGIILL